MSRITLPLLVALASACLPALGAPRAFVASDGSDANPCTLNSPCRNFQAAHNAVDVGGEVVALDSAGFGSLVITKSVTVMSSPGAFAGIAVGSGDAVSIATAGVNVVLRGLVLSNTGPGIGGGTTTGVRMTAGNSLAVENCVLSRFNSGVFVVTAARVKVVDSLFRASGGLYLTNGATAEVSGSKFLGNLGLGFGLSVSGAAGTTTSATIVDTVSSDNFSGFVATSNVASGHVRLSCLRCTASNNAQIGFLNGAGVAGATAQMLVSSSLASYNGQWGFTNFIVAGGTATFESLGNNALHQNTMGPTNGPITTVAGF